MEPISDGSLAEWIHHTDFVFVALYTNTYCPGPQKQASKRHITIINHYHGWKWFKPGPIVVAIDFFHLHMTLYK